MSEREYFTYNGVTYDITWNESEVIRHGGPFDRGSADSYYQRGTDPHYFVDGTYRSDRVERDQMTKDEVNQYFAGYEYNETVTMGFKEY